MPKQLPSQFFPEYLQLDLGVGTESPHPLSRALDQSVENALNTLQERMRCLIPSAMDESNRRRVLGYLGFECTQLKEGEVTALYDMAFSLLRAKGTLGAIRMLAALYLGEIEVFVGRPDFEELHNGPQQSFLLGDPSAKEDLVFVRLSSELPQDRIQEFTSNAKVLLPSGFHLKVAPMKKKIFRQTKKEIGKPFALEGWRL